MDLKKIIIRCWSLKCREGSWPSLALPFWCLLKITLNIWRSKEHKNNLKNKQNYYMFLFFPPKKTVHCRFHNELELFIVLSLCGLKDRTHCWQRKLVRGKLLCHGTEKRNWSRRAPYKDTAVALLEALRVWINYRQSS